MPVTEECLTIQFQSLQVESLSEDDKVIRGAVMALEGDFKDGRGAFDKESLTQIAAMVNSFRNGLKSRFGHPSLLSDGLGRFLGRWLNARVGTALNTEGQRVAAVRGDLHLDESSFHTPFGNLGGYVLKVAKSAPDAVSSSLVIAPLIEQRDRGRPPVWYPAALKASDIVEDGAAVGSLLHSKEELRAKLQQILDTAFDDEPLDAVEEFFAQYKLQKLSDAQPTPELDKRKAKAEAMAKAVGAFRK